METLTRLCSQRLERKSRSRAAVGEAHMQSAQPRDIGVLVLVIGVFLILFVVTLTMGSPVR
jgi:tetrahydromethanopterin S-methyltransferase subunit G